MQPTQTEPLRRLRALADTPLLLAALTVLVFCYPFSGAFAWPAAAALAALCCLGSPPALGAAYVFLFLFDGMLPFPPLGGSLVRVLQIGILLRVSFLMLQTRTPPDRFSVATAALTATSCGVSFLLKGPVGDSVSFGAGILVLLALRAALRMYPSSAQGLPARPEAGMTGALRRMMRAYAVSAVAAVLVGVLYNRFFVLDRGALVRFLGTSEPNFMAMYLDVAIVLWLLLPPLSGHFGRRLLDFAALGTLLGGLALTGSLTGMAIAGCMLLACAWRICQKSWEEATSRRRLGAFGLRLVCGAAIAAVVFAGGQWLARSRPQRERDIYAVQVATGIAGADTPAYIAEEEYRALRAAGQPAAPHLLTAAEWAAYREAHGIRPVVPKLAEAEPLLQDGLAQALRRIPVVGGRLYTALGFARRYGLDVATSGRWGLLTEKLRDFAGSPWWQRLLGRGPDPETTYFPMQQNFGYSHNSYLDMLTGFGAAGLAALLWWFARTLRRGRFFGLPVDGEEGGVQGADIRSALTLARVALLLHAATLSMHPNRLFLFFFFG